MYFYPLVDGILKKTVNQLTVLFHPNKIRTGQVLQRHIANFKEVLAGKARLHLL
jgi:hypothetical protein